jgi:hypothetical protein
MDVEAVRDDREIRHLLLDRALLQGVETWASELVEMGRNALSDGHDGVKRHRIRF